MSANAQAAVVTPLKKITITELLGKKPDKPEKATDLAIIFGVAMQALRKPTQYNPEQDVLYGRFEAIRISDQARFSSDTLYLPEPMQSRIAASLVNPGTGEVLQADIAFKISIIPSAKSSAGYTFTVEPVLDMKAQDSLALVRSQVLNRLPALLPSPGAKPK